MSTLSENEFRSLHGHPGTAVTVSMTGTSAATASALTAGQMYEITCSSGFHYELGASPTATTSSKYWPPKLVKYMVLNSDLKVAFIKATGEDDATVWVTPLTGHRV